MVGRTGPAAEAGAAVDDDSTTSRSSSAKWKLNVELNIRIYAVPIATFHPENAICHLVG